MYDIVKCSSCGYVGTVDSKKENCPKCGKDELLFEDDKNTSSDKPFVVKERDAYNTGYLKHNGKFYKTSIDDIRILKDNEIFVFGSNESGIHGAGAAFLANKKFGAVYGEGIGLFGKSYAIPTKDKKIITLNLTSVKKYVEEFIKFAKNNKDKNFLVTQIGCGLAGHKVKDIAPMFKDTINMDNVFLPRVFVENIISKEKK